MDWIDVVLMVVAWAVVVFLWIPPLKSTFNLASSDCVPVENLIGGNAAEEDPTFLAFREQLLELGFEPVGQIEQVVLYFGSHWRWTEEHHAFTSSRQPVYATLHRTSSSLPYEVSFVSFFADGMMLQTNSTGTLSAEFPGLELLTLKSYEAKTVLDYHLVGVERLEQEHGEVGAPHNLDECIEVQKATFEAAMRAGAIRSAGRAYR